MANKDLIFNSLSEFSVTINIDEEKDESFIIPINSTTVATTYSGKLVRQGNTKTEVIFIENTDFVVNRVGGGEDTITFNIIGSKYLKGTYLGALESFEKDSNRFFKANLTLNVI